jgi:hypothetical protein
MGDASSPDASDVSRTPGPVRRRYGAGALRERRPEGYQARRQPAEVRLPGGGVRIRRSALQAWLCRLEQPQQEDRPA